MYNNIIHRYVIRYSNCKIKYFKINLIFYYILIYTIRNYSLIIRICYVHMISI